MHRSVTIILATVQHTHNVLHVTHISTCCTQIHFIDFIPLSLAPWYSLFSSQQSTRNSASRKYNAYSFSVDEIPSKIRKYIHHTQHQSLKCRYLSLEKYLYPHREYNERDQHALTLSSRCEWLLCYLMHLLCSLCPVSRYFSSIDR